MARTEVVHRAAVDVHLAVELGAQRSPVTFHDVRQVEVLAPVLRHLRHISPATFIAIAIIGHE